MCLPPWLTEHRSLHKNVQVNAGQKLAQNTYNGFYCFFCADDRLTLKRGAVFVLESDQLTNGSQKF